MFESLTTCQRQLADFGQWLKFPGGRAVSEKIRQEIEGQKACEELKLATESFRFRYDTVLIDQSSFNAPLVGRYEYLVEREGQTLSLVDFLDNHPDLEMSTIEGSFQDSGQAHRGGTYTEKVKVTGYAYQGKVVALRLIVEGAREESKKPTIEEDLAIDRNFLQKQDVTAIVVQNRVGIGRKSFIKAEKVHPLGIIMDTDYYKIRGLKRWR